MTIIKHRATVLGAMAVAFAVVTTCLCISKPSAADVPQAWLQYAILVTQQFQNSLAASDPVAARFHAFLEDAALSARERPPSDLIVKAWFDAGGRVTRVEFDSLGPARSDADLRYLLMRADIGRAPPTDMLQPLRLRVSLLVRT